MNEHRGVCEHHSVVDENSRMVKEIHAAIMGTMDGKEGLIPKVQRHDRQLAGLNRFVWLIVGAMVVAVSAMIQAQVVK